VSSLLGDAFAHHAWATEQLIDVCAGLPAEQLATPAPGTYGPILETLRHLVQSDSWYLSFFTGRPGLTDDEAARMELHDLRAVISADGAAWAEVLAGEDDPDREIVERDGGWVVRSPVGVRLAQVVHHGSDHRSQVCTALTSLGHEPPEFDVWAYARATGRERGEETAR
jgi:uncharacterized damage-inducible protein DinB